MISMNERRAEERVSAEHPVQVTILSAPSKPDLENCTFKCTTADVSASGIRFVLPDLPPLGGTVELRLHCDDENREFWHIGKVVWADPPAEKGQGYSIGVKFTETPQATLALWSEVIRDKLARRSQAAS